jgi:hypothetical protein
MKIFIDNFFVMIVDHFLYQQSKIVINNLFSDHQ